MGVATRIILPIIGVQNLFCNVLWERPPCSYILSYN